MADKHPVPVEDPPSAEDAPVSESDALERELADSLASVWARFAGSRPSDAALEFARNGVVRWVLPGGTEPLERGLEESSHEEDPAARRTMSGYVRATSDAVSRVTHSRVSARISKRDSKTGAATETFILEAPAKRY